MGSIVSSSSVRIALHRCRGIGEDLDCENDHKCTLPWAYRGTEVEWTLNFVFYPSGQGTCDIVAHLAVVVRISWSFLCRAV